MLDIAARLIAAVTANEQLPLPDRLAVRRQFELERGGARLWCTVDEETRTICILDVHTPHQNATK